MNNEAKTLEYLDKYFSNKSYSFGGPIPKSALLSKPEIFNMSFEQAIDYAHDLIKKAEPLNSKYKFISVDWQIQYIISIIYECCSLRIPKEHQGAIVILHSLYCKGYREKIYVYDVVA